MEKKVLSEIKRINDLMGIQVLNEALIPPSLRSMFDELGSFTKKTKPGWLTPNVEAARTNIIDYFQNLSKASDANINDLLDDFYTLATANSKYRDVISTYFRQSPSLKSFYDDIGEIVSEKLAQMDLTNISDAQVYNELLSEIMTEYPLRLQAAGVPLPPNLNKFLELSFSDDVFKEISDLQKVAQVSKKVTELSSDYWKKWFQFNKEKYANQIRDDLATLTAAKSGKSPLNQEAANVLKKRIFENMRHLYMAGRSAYKRLQDDLQVIIDGTTNTKNKDFYQGVLDMVKRDYGDWELIEQISKQNAGWEKYFLEIQQALKSGYSLEKTIKNIVMSPTKIKSWIEDLLKVRSTDVNTIVKPEWKQPAWRATWNWASQWSPRGMPIGANNLKNYEDIIKLSDYWGAWRSWAYEALVRGSKISIYITLAWAVYNTILTAFRDFEIWFYTGITGSNGEKERCLQGLKKEIEKSNLTIEQTVTFINEGKHPCIFTFGWEENEIQEMIVMAHWLAKSNDFMSILWNIIKNLAGRMTSNPYLQGPPAISLPALIVDFTQKGLNQVMQEQLPPVTMPRPTLPTGTSGTAGTSGTSGTGISDMLGPIKLSTDTVNVDTTAKNPTNVYVSRPKQ